jgi:hypothetical protein
VLVAEVVLKLELLESEHPSNQCVHVEYVDYDQQEEENGENVVESLPEDRDNVGITHHLRKGGVSVVYHLQEVNTQRRRYARRIAWSDNRYMAKKSKEAESVCRPQ